CGAAELPRGAFFLLISHKEAQETQNIEAAKRRKRRKNSLGKAEPQKAQNASQYEGHIMGWMLTCGEGGFGRGWCVVADFDTKAPRHDGKAEERNAVTGVSRD